MNENEGGKLPLLVSTSTLTVMERVREIKNVAKPDPQEWDGVIPESASLVYAVAELAQYVEVMHGNIPPVSERTIETVASVPEIERRLNCGVLPLSVQVFAMCNALRELHVCALRLQAKAEGNTGKLSGIDTSAQSYRSLHDEVKAGLGDDFDDGRTITAQLNSLRNALTASRSNNLALHEEVEALRKKVVHTEGGVLTQAQYNALVCSHQRLVARVSDLETEIGNATNVADDPYSLADTPLLRELVDNKLITMEEMMNPCAEEIERQRNNVATGEGHE